jgi:hypothetical protein
LPRSRTRAGCGEERLLERLDAEAPLHVLDRLEEEQPAAVEQSDAVGERLRLVHVVRAEEDRRVVLGSNPADELLHLELRPRIEAGRRLVEQEQDRRGQERPREGDLLLHPARQVLHRLAAPIRREADPAEDLGHGRARLARRHPVEPRGIGQVLGRGHLLEEARLDRDAVDEPADRRRVLHDVVAEDPRLAAVVDQERREQADERRLPRAVLAEDGNALAAGDREGDVVERRPRTLARESARMAILAPEGLPQVAHLDGRRPAVKTCGQFGCGWCESGHAAPSDEAGTEDGKPPEGGART